MVIMFFYIVTGSIKPDKCQEIPDAKLAIAAGNG